MTEIASKKKIEWNELTVTGTMICNKILDVLNGYSAYFWLGIECTLTK